jgi:hypothetical protein
LLKLAARYLSIYKSGAGLDGDEHEHNDDDQLIDLNYLAIFLGLHIDDSARPNSPKVCIV